MNIKELSHNLQKVYLEMSETFSGYQTKTGWNCSSGCVKCCQKPDIEASVLEMIPMAFRIYHEGTIDYWLDKLNTSELTQCPVLLTDESGKGQCELYNERPSVCRMFGVAGYFDKNHKTTLSVCRVLRADFKIENTSEIPHPEVPMITEWSFRLSSLHPDLIQNKMPLNQALIRALEKVALFTAYQEQNP